MQKLTDDRNAIIFKSLKVGDLVKWESSDGPESGQIAALSEKRNSVGFKYNAEIKYSDGNILVSNLTKI